VHLVHVPLTDPARVQEHHLTSSTEPHLVHLTSKQEPTWFIWSPSAKAMPCKRPTTCSFVGLFQLISRQWFFSDLRDCLYLSLQMQMMGILDALMLAIRSDTPPRSPPTATVPPLGSRSVGMMASQVPLASTQQLAGKAIAGETGIRQDWQQRWAAAPYMFLLVACQSR
jgi:hypothetical protein